MPLLQHQCQVQRPRNTCLLSNLLAVPYIFANIELEKEPAPHELRDWIISTREIVSNAFSYDSSCAMSWVMSVENASTIEEFDEECLYPILDNRFNAALRKCIASKLIVAKISRLTEEAQVKRGTRLKSHQILFCLIEYLRPDEVGSQLIRTNELLRLSLGRAVGSAPTREIP